MSSWREGNHGGNGFIREPWGKWVYVGLPVELKRGPGREGGCGRAGGGGASVVLQTLYLHWPPGLVALINEGHIALNKAFLLLKGSDGHQTRQCLAEIAENGRQGNGI